MKRSVEWHEECLKHMEHNVEQVEREAARVMANAERLRADVDFLRQQIAAAKQRGMTEFEGERLLRNNRSVKRC